MGRPKKVVETPEQTTVEKLQEQVNACFTADSKLRIHVEDYIHPGMSGRVTYEAYIQLDEHRRVLIVENTDLQAFVTGVIENVTDLTNMLANTELAST